MKRNLTIIVLGFCIAVSTSCVSTWLYFPTSEIRHTPDEAGMPYEDLYIQSTGGIRINAWWVPARDARYTILLCHGNGGNISHRIGKIEILHGQGFNVFIFDYRGYGRSDGTPSEQGLYDDAACAWKHLTVVMKHPPSSVIVWGTSLGGSVAARLASTTAPRALVLESAFHSLAEVTHHHMPIYPQRLCLNNVYNTYRSLENVRSPVLVIHSREDTTIPYDQGLRLFEAAPGPKRFMEILGSHNKGFFDSRETVCAGLWDFLRSTR
ncbi:MAG: alpha/beta hydrolase [Spirochaetes bacterium]|nr:alpha/beta hydrolase [Spirochaetota bacterium]